MCIDIHTQTHTQNIKSRKCVERKNQMLQDLLDNIYETQCKMNQMFRIDSKLPNRKKQKLATQQWRGLYCLF